MNRPTPTEECALDPNIHTYGEYTRCLNSKLSNPYIVGYENMRTAPLSSIKNIFFIVAIIFIIILISRK